MIIYLKGCYYIDGEISWSEDTKFNLNVPVEGKKDVTVNIILDEKRVESFFECEISKDMWNELQNEKLDGEKIPFPLHYELLEMKSCISDAAKKVLHLIKYCFQNTRLNENLLSGKGEYWSTNKLDWKMLPYRLSVSLDNSKSITLNRANQKVLQEYIEKQFYPFLALRHLHRAKNESHPRYKWIDATIAAELAIKEFLIRKVSNIEALLIEVPSPPLEKLYGVILKEYAGEKSPKLKELKKGAEIRNKLLHRPKFNDIDEKKANEYVHDVETAIYHLLFLLYPTDSRIYSLYVTYP